MVSQLGEASVNQPGGRFTPNHYPIRPYICKLCHTREADPDKSICSNCYQTYGYANFDPYVVNDPEKRETQWLRKMAWQPPPGTYTMSGAAVALQMTVRGLYKAMERLDIVPEDNAGHSVISDTQLRNIEQNLRNHQGDEAITYWRDGTIKVTSKLAGELIDDDPCTLNALARGGIVSGFLMEFSTYGGFAAKRWQIDAVALQNYLDDQQRCADARRLRRDIPPLWSGLGAPAGAGPLLS